MTIPKIITIIFAVLGCAAALIAAYYWFRASNVSVNQPSASISDYPELHIMSNEVAFNESSRLNSIAARWTGAAALLGAVSSIAGIF
jgi:hypothetical protein